MNPTRWEQIRTVFDQLVELAEAERVSRLEAIGTTDPDLRDAVSDLLRADAEAGSVAGVASPHGFTLNAPKIEAEDSLSPDEIQQALGGAYAVERELSGAGMSHVYVAEERAFGRKVVVKVLRPELAEVTSAKRFEREIQLAARLQHPHIVPLLSAGEVNGLLYYTMPFVEGESLRDRLHREGELPIDATIRIVRDVASALAYAHRRGVIHRDIKPENVLLSEGGAVVADFGIAKALIASRARGEDATTTTLTQRGTALGTPLYMAPEQATGDPMTDHRVDLYALGVVAYELLAGRPPLEGRSSQQVMAAHATEVPQPINKRRPATPAALAELVMRCLEKRPADRPQEASELVAALDTLRNDPPRPASAPTEPGAAIGTPSRHVRTSPRAWAITAVGALVIIFAAVMTQQRRPRSHLSPAWFDLALPDSLAPWRSYGAIALSPDGSVVAYVAAGAQAIVVRRLGQLTPQRLLGTEGARCPSFSPDGRWIVFTSLSGLKKVAVNGGPPTVISDSVGLCGVWTDRNEIVFDVGLRGLFRVSANGGPVSLLTPSDTAKGIGILVPSQALPGGEGALITLSETFTVDFQLGFVSLPDGRIVKLQNGRSSPEYRPQYADGHLLFVREEGRLIAAPFSLRELRFIGPEVRVHQDEILTFSAAPNGQLAYVSLARQPLALVAVTEQGSARVLGGRADGTRPQSAITPLDTAYYSWPRVWT